MLYTGIIIANKHDIYKELGSDNVTGNFHKIPFLTDSHYYDDAFRPDETRRSYTIDIRIELYSYEDIHELAANRNEVFIKLLNNEFSIKTEDEIEESNPHESISSHRKWL